MPEWEVVIGPPGCGKTTALMEYVREEIKNGRAPDEIAAVTFTRAGAGEIVRRVALDLGIDGLELPWARTIHSTAYQLLQVERGRIMSAKAWKRFGERFSYTLSDLDPGDAEEHALEAPTRTEDDTLRHAYEWGRARRLTLDEIEYRYDPPLRGEQFRTYVRRYEQFKTQEGLRDFADLLEHSLAGRVPPVNVAFIDEAQDLSPAQVACVERWFASCERVVVVGDADQAIYEFQGANPDWLTGLARRTTPRVLGQSYRVPAEPHAQARAVITRNRDRLDAPYAPRPAMGSVEPMTLSVALRRLDPAVRTFILVRNRKFLEAPASYCLTAGFPYLVEGNGGPCPYRREKLVAAIRVALRLSEGDPCTAGELAKLLDFVPSRGSDLLVHGTKTGVKNLHHGKKLYPQDVERIGAAGLLAALAQDGPLSVFKNHVKASEIAYFDALLKRYHDIPDPPIILTTIHGAKGREADRVLVCSDMARATWREYQTPEGEAAENRVFYVAATRTRDELWLILNETELYYRWPPYERPEPPALAPAPELEFSLDDVEQLPFTVPDAPAPWRVVWIEAISRYVTIARNDSTKAAALEDVPHLVCYSEEEYQLLRDLELDDEVWFKIHAHLTAFPRWTVEGALSANIPNWEGRLKRRRRRSRGLR